MAEKPAPGGVMPLGSKDHDQVPEKVALSQDSESDISPEEEMELLRQHQSHMRQETNRRPYMRTIHRSREPTGRTAPERSYAAQAATATVLDVYIGRSGGLRDNPPNGRHRPRSVRIHTPNASIVPSALIKKLADSGIKPSHLQRLPNGDLEITFHTLADKSRFFYLPYVHPPRRSWEPGMDNPPPIWVRVSHKPAELQLDALVRRFEGFGRVLFARENADPGTDVMNCMVTMKMILQQPVPSFVHLGMYCLAVRHYGQPQTCRKCDSRGHIASQCSAKRCYNCGMTGHINADCTEISRCQGCGSTGHHIVQCDTSWVSEARMDPDEPSSDLSSDDDDDDDQEQMPNNDAALAPVAISDTQDSQGAHTETSETDPEIQETAAAEEAPSTELSPAQSDESEHAAKGAGADLAPEEMAVTHVRSSSDGDVGTENCQIAAPEGSASIQDSTTQDDNGQTVKNWYDLATPSPDGMSPSLTFSSPLPIFTKSSVGAGPPAASKRSFHDDSVSDISAVRRPSTKKKPKGRSVRHPAPS